MALAIFGISNGGLNLVVNLLVLMLVVVWLALIVYTYLDARRRISDPFLVGCATLASFIPYLGTAVYAIVRPPEFLEDAHERELEIEAAELRVRQLKEASCPGCGFPVERNYLRCPQCQRRLKEPCPSCSKPVDRRWALCPYCEAPVREGEPRRRKRPAESEPAAERRKAPPEERKRPAREEREAPKRKPQRPKAENDKRPQRSPSREPDVDPRKA
jgi:Double zinc ribbon